MPKRVAIDLRMVGKVQHGISRYALALWNGLPARKDLQYLALARSDGLPRIAARRPGDEILVTRSPFLSPLEQVELPLVLRRARIDVLHATSFSVPAGSRGPLVLSLHDLTHLAFPELHGPGRRLYYRTIVGPAARRAARVLTVSEFSRGEIERWLFVPRERIAVAPNAVDIALPFPAPPKAQPPILLAVGNGKPHKNLELLVRVLPLVTAPARLVLVGEGLEGLASSTVEVRGPLGDTALARLYAEATLFLCPSRSEGFGLTPLEAARCGTPVIVAATSALEEAWRGVAPLLAPDDVVGWAEEIERLLGDDAARAALAERCHERAEEFASWRPLLDAAETAYRLALERP